MVRLVAAIACALMMAAPRAEAQALFANPFASAAEYRSARGGTTDATYRLRYEVSRSELGRDAVVSELSIDVAPDWSLVRESGRTTLRDFKLNRTFALETDRFTTQNGLADLVFRVMERQNRSYLQQVVAGLGVRAEMPDDCDAESELGLAIPGATAPTTSLRERRGVVRLMCANREIGGFVLGEGSPPPEAFWPTLFQEITVHPSLHQRVRDSGRAPTRIDIAFRVSPEAVTTRSWRLIAIETATLAYPLNDSMQNTTAETLDQLLGPGIGQTAADAVAGRALGGPPSLQSWGEHLRAVTRNNGPAAAAMLLLPTHNMFPELAGVCATPAQHPACDLNRNLRTIAQGDPAPLALIEIGMAEQQGTPRPPSRPCNAPKVRQIATTPRLALHSPWRCLSSATTILPKHEPPTCRRMSRRCRPVRLRRYPTIPPIGQTSAIATPSTMNGTLRFCFTTWHSRYLCQAPSNATRY